MDFAARFVTESAAIEGQDIPATEIAACGHMEAYKSIPDGPLTEADIKNWQNLIGEEQWKWGDSWLPENYLGEYREHDIYIGGKRIGWQNIRDDMASLVAEANNVPMASLPFAAYLHWRYERIHPFADGNGRSGRLFALWFLRRHDLPLVLFTEKDRGDTYYPCFSQPTPILMAEYFRTHSE